MIVACIPAYNEEKTIAKVILLAQKHADKVIVCDDGSTDMTGEIAERLGAIVIRHEKNLGYGAALRSLFQKTRTMNSDFLITLDADAQHKPIEMTRLLQSLMDDEADIVIGSRVLEDDNRIPAYRRFGIKLLTKATKGYGENKLSDAQSGFRAYNRKAIENLTILEDGMGASAEILLEARNLGLRVVEVPVHTYYKGLDTSTYNPFRHGLSVFSTIIKLVVEERPLVYLGVPGVALLSVGVLFGLWTVQIYAAKHYVVTNIALTSAVFGLAGMFTLWTSITLYAISRLMQKTNKR